MAYLKLLSWNVNGIRAVHKKGFMDWFRQQNADIICVQETKAQVDQIPEEIAQVDGYKTYFTAAEKKGYSGVGLFTKQEPLKVEFSFGVPKFDSEGRIIFAEFPEFVFYGIYFPNGQMSEERLNYKLEFYDAFLAHAEKQKANGKKIVVTGDVNTAHKEIDLARPKENVNNSGFLPVERAWVDKFVQHGYVDTLRLFTQEGGQYSYWDQRFNARARNVGWRIDYFFVSENLKPNVRKAYIQPDVLGSDHCPVGLDLEI